MGILCKKHSKTIPYYELLKKEMKKSYDKICSSEFNISFSLKINEFVPSRKKIVKIIGETTDWKLYLLDHLDITEENSWKNSIYNYIINNSGKWNSKKYGLENKMFIEHFSFRNFPQQTLKKSEINPTMNFMPIFSPFSDSEEINKFSKKLKEKSIELTNINTDTTEKIDKNENKNNNDILDEKQSTSKIIGVDDSRNESIDIKNPVNSIKYNINQIRKYINLIREQLEKEEHPISFIINEFAKNYSVHITTSCDSIKGKPSEIEDTKEKIIKNIQFFIKIMSVALKLFYMKAINYNVFVSERDEFTNLICYILFKDKDFYKSLFNLFELSNIKNNEDLKSKKEGLERLEQIFPKDVGVDPKFCLDNENKKKALKTMSNKKKHRLIDFIKEIEELEQLHTKSFIESGNKTDKSFETFRYRERSNTDYKEEKNRKTEENKNNEKIVNIKNSSMIDDNNSNININEIEVKRKDTITSYKEFSERFNSRDTSLLDLYQEDIYKNPSEFEYPKVEKVDEQEPYEKAIKFIERINQYTIPLDKLTIIALVSVIITDYINLFWEKEKKNETLPDKFLNIDSDELLSIYLYIVFKMNLDSIYTQLDFIKYFTGDISKQSMVGYYYTTVEGCLKFIMGVDKKEDFCKKEE